MDICPLFGYCIQYYFTIIHEISEYHMRVYIVYDIILRGYIKKQEKGEIGY